MGLRQIVYNLRTSPISGHVRDRLSDIYHPTVDQKFEHISEPRSTPRSTANHVGLRVRGWESPLHLDSVEYIVLDILNQIQILPVVLYRTLEIENFFRRDFLSHDFIP